MEIEQLKQFGQKLMSAVVPGTSNSENSQNSYQECIKRFNVLNKTVEECKTIFSGKTILATDDNTHVADMCNQWVNVMTHGLRAPVSTYQPIQNLITAGLNYAFNLNLLDVSLWDYTRVHLTRHEEERYKQLKNVNTPIGYFKAFLRSALNERSLERYLHSWTTNYLILEYYEDWALVRNSELSKRLLLLATDLSSILFAMAIDKPELNESLTATSQISTTVEPVIAMSTPITKNINKKTLRQVISFDSAEHKTSRSLSSSLETKSDICENIQENRKNSSDSKELHRVNSITTDKSYENKLIQCSENNVKDNPREILAELTEKARDVFSSSFFSDSLSHQDSDLSSISGDKRKSDCDIDDVILQNGTDFFEFTLPANNLGTDGSSGENFSDLKQQNLFLEQRVSILENTLEDKLSEIYNLTSENKHLKEQLSNYLSAIKRLDQDVDNDEIKHYEKKLVEVAQMHAELMEFNNMLQKQLQLQQNTIGYSSRIQNDLSEINTLIPSTYLISKGSKTFHVYQVFLKIKSEEWNIYRRYSEFRKFYEELKNSYPIISSFSFPPKKVLRKKEAWLVEQRRNQLQTWLKHVLNIIPQIQHCTKKTDIVCLLPFFGDAGYADNSGVLIPIATT